MTSQPQSVEDDEVVLKRRQKHETNLTSGLGYGRAKLRQLEVFWNTIWPSLQEAGWTKDEGKGEKAGTMTFIPEGVDVRCGRKSRDFYVRIRDVTDRLLEKRNEVETKIANAYLDQIMLLDEDSEYDAAVQQPKRILSPRHATRLDLSWKEGGSIFPRSCSRVGSDYQALDLPLAGTFEDSPYGTLAGLEKPRETLHDQVWDPARAKAAGMLDHVHLHVKHNQKEAAMLALHDLNYDKEKLSNELPRLKSVSGSNFSQEEKDTFRFEIFRHRKNLTFVAKSMNKSVNSCMAYYLGTFKKSDDYRLLKTLCAEERADKLAATDLHGLDACGICGDGGSLLICDGCEGEYHMACMKPPLVVIPEGYWECDDCINHKFLKARDNLIRNTRLYEKVHDLNKKRKAEESTSDGNTSDEKRFKKNDGTSTSLPKDSRDFFVRPTPQVLNAVKKLASSISQILAMPEKQVNVHSAKNGTEDGQALASSKKQLVVHAGITGAEGFLFEESVI